MTREELTARLRKLTGKTVTDIESLDERVDALEASAGGGGVELKTLDVTVTFSGVNHTYTGIITSEIPENTVINNIIKIENVTVNGSGQEAITSYQPLPMSTGRYDNNNVVFTGYETYSKLDQVPAGMVMPLGLVFAKVDGNSNSTEITETFKITYV